MICLCAHQSPYPLFMSSMQVVSLVGTTASDFVAPSLRSMLGGIAVLQVSF